jgi:hypothetical protein
MNPILTRVSIMAVGCSRYDDPALPELPGPENDVGRIRHLLVEDSATALYTAEQFIELLQPTAEQLRTELINYSISRTAPGDILVFYYSGHGVTVGLDDFGFCSKDTVFHPAAGIVEPLSVVKYSDLLHTLAIASIIPIVIIDACYSGIAGQKRVPPLDIIDSMQNATVTQAASKYALFCSCADVQVSLDTRDGGVFSNYLSHHAAAGMARDDLDKPYLSLEDLYKNVEESVMNYSADVTPRLYWGSQLPEIPFVKNTQYAPLEYGLEKYLICVIRELWNNGNERELRPKEIDQLCGKGAYGNHSKLSYTPWALVETVEGPKRRRLTERGRQFARGELSVSQRIIFDPNMGDFVPIAGSPTVYINTAD